MIVSCLKRLEPNEKKNSQGVVVTDLPLFDDDANGNDTITDEDSNAANETTSPRYGCIWSGWTEWSECTPFGEEIRVREKLLSDSGVCDGGNKEIRACAENETSSPRYPPNAVGCIWSEWTEWRECTPFGEEIRVREKLPAINMPLSTCDGGNEETRVCAANETSTDEPLVGVETTTFPQDLGKNF